jgi:hypothetical protein
MDLLLECFQAQRYLLVLDNLESLLQAYNPEGRFRVGYEDYAVLLRRVAQTPHQSCLLLTSRETPAELVPGWAGARGLRAALPGKGRRWHHARPAAPRPAVCGQPAGPENRRRGPHRPLRGRDRSLLQGVEMQDATLSEATLRDAVFTEVFHAIWAVAISARGTFWAAASSRGEVRVWREGGHTLHRAWQAHADTVERALAFSPDERLLATGSWDGTIKLWDVESGALLWTGWHTDVVESLAFAPNGTHLVSGCFDGRI